MKHLFSFLLLIVSATSLYGQHISIFDIDTTASPKMKAKFYALDAGDRVQNPGAGELRLTEDGKQRTITAISCPPSKPLENVSVAMSIDISGSMGVSDFGKVPVELGKRTARQLCSAVAMPPSEFALQICNDRAAIVQDLTTDRTAVLNGVDLVQAGGENDFVEHLLNPLTGLLTVAKVGKYKKIAVLYTDAWWYPLTPQEVQRCKDTCSKYAITFYAVIYSRPESDPNGIKTSLREIAEYTGGALYDGITSETAADDIAAREKHVFQGEPPCTIEWQSDTHCSQELVNVSLSWQNRSSTNYYTASPKALEYLEFSPMSYHFDAPPIGSAVTQVITVTARNATFAVNAIRPSNPAFSLTPSVFTLNPNESRTLTLSYSASDSGFAFTRFLVENDRCPQFFYASGGYGRIRPAVPTLKVTQPNNGDIYAVGSDTVIRWEGISPTDTVRIDYSIDRGASWLPITPKATGLQYSWSPVPRPASTNCLVRVQQPSGDGGGAGSNAQDRILGYCPDAVFSLAYSPTGTTIATGTANNLLQLWNVSNGQISQSIFASNLYVRSVAFSPTGDTVVTVGGTDFMIMMWKAATGQLLRMFSGHTGDVQEVVFSPDGTALASAGDKTLKIWDVATGKIRWNLKGHTDGVHAVAYSKDGRIVASGSSDRTIKLWDVSTGTELHTLTGHTDGAWSLAFSPDGKTLASGSYDMTVRVWDIATGQQLRVMTGHHVQSIAYSPDGRTIATGGLENTIMLWDMATGKAYRTLIGHNLVVNGVAFSPDGSTLASCSADRAVRLWNMTENIVQEDQSDTVFTIAEPLAATHDIIMGQVLVGRMKDSAVTNFVENYGSYPFTVNSISFRGADSAAFRFVSGTPPYQMRAMSQKAAEVRFRPNRVGLHTAEIVIITQSDTLVRTIEGEGIAPQVSLSGKIIDFGRVVVGQYKDSLQIPVLTNIGTTPVTITSTKLGYLNTRDFSTGSAGSFTLNPGETHELYMRFTPHDIGRVSGTVEFSYNGVGSPAVLPLFGEGIITGTGGGGGSSLVYIPNDSGAAGDRRVLHLMRNGIRLDTIASAFEATLRMQNTILAPMAETAILRSRRRNDSIYVTIAGSLGSGMEIAQLPCIVGLGSVENSTVDIVDFSLYDSNRTKVSFPILTRSGLFTLLGICHEGGDRLISSAAATSSLLQLSSAPNDATTTITLHLPEKGNSTLTIYTADGTAVNVYSFDEAGEYQVALDERNFSTGVYYLRLVTPTLIRHDRLLIYK
ncbi:MAG: choice-of-anchor D domain-containing protein [Candidatus Kapaibacterium sp.]